MENCAKYQEALYLEVYGELNPADYPDWEKHLRSCEHCRKERESLHQFLQTVKQTIPTPLLSSEQIKRQVRLIQEKLQEEKDLSWQEKWRRVLFPKFAPAVATVCVVLIIISWLGWKEFKKFEVNSPSFPTTLEKQIDRNDLEVIKHLEFLKEMDEVEKLVRLLDKPGNSLPSPYPEGREGKYGGNDG